MTTTIFTMMMCFLVAGEPIYCKPIAAQDNLYTSLMDCNAALYPRENTKDIEFFCAKKEIPVWQRAK